MACDQCRGASLVYAGYCNDVWSRFTEGQVQPPSCVARDSLNLPLLPLGSGVPLSVDTDVSSLNLGKKTHTYIKTLNVPVSLNKDKDCQSVFKREQHQ